MAEPKGAHAAVEIDRSSEEALGPVRFSKHGSDVFWQSGRRVVRGRGDHVEVVSSLADDAWLQAVDDDFLYIGAGARLERLSRRTGTSEPLPPVWDIARFVVDEGSVYWIDTKWSLHTVPRVGGELGPSTALETSCCVTEVAVAGGIAWATTSNGLRRFEGGRAESRHLLSEDDRVLGRAAIHGDRVFATVARDGSRPSLVSFPR
jgi:hypothetical protein